jgi:hypothetical protein
MNSIGFQAGDVVCCYRGTPSEVYGVVRGYVTTMNHYRVRVSTKSADDYVELGVSRKNMAYANPCDEDLADLQVSP